MFVNMSIDVEGTGKGMLSTLSGLSPLHALGSVILDAIL